MMADSSDKALAAHGRYCFAHEVKGKALVLAYGMPRSGSRFIYHCLCNLFPEGGVVATHDYLLLDQSVPIIVGIRDPRDCVVSHWRFRMPDAAARGHLLEEELVQLAGKYLHASWIAEHYVGRHQETRVLRFEEWTINHERLFDTLTSHLRIDITPHQRADILAAHNIERARAISRGEISAHWKPPLEAGHVHEGLAGTWRRYVQAKHVAFLNHLLAPALDAWGYAHDS